jgi:hypothetical protein
VGKLHLWIPTTDLENVRKSRQLVIDLRCERPEVHESEAQASPDCVCAQSPGSCHTGRLIGLAQTALIASVAIVGIVLMPAWFLWVLLPISVGIGWSLIRRPEGLTGAIGLLGTLLDPAKAIGTRDPSCTCVTPGEHGRDHDAVDQ